MTSFTAGQKLRATDLAPLESTHTAAYRQTVNQTGIATATDTKATFDTADYTSADVSYSGGVFTLNRAGLWHVHGVLRMGFFASGFLNLTLGTGTSTTSRFDHVTTPFGINATASVSFIRQMNAGDTVALWIWQNTGGAMATDVSFAGNRMELAWLRG